MNSTLRYIFKKFQVKEKYTNPIFLKNFGRADLALLLKELNFIEGAEIGVDRGAFSEILCQVNPNLHLFSIDSWSTSSFEDPLNTKVGMQKNFDKHYIDAVRRLSPYNCEIIKKESLEAIKQFSDESLDFVYIDANHSFVNIANDLYRWEKKVKKGGIVAGHDYQHFPPERDNHVKHVVDAFAQAFEISPYFELGQDRYNSWFWVKSI